jgi:hypothetical protein
MKVEPDKPDNWQPNIPMGRQIQRQYGVLRYVQRTRDVVLAHWPAIKALAAALVEAGRLERAEIEKIVLPLIASAE